LLQLPPLRGRAKRDHLMLHLPDPVVVPHPATQLAVEVSPDAFSQIIPLVMISPLGSINVSGWHRPPSTESV
jgi:hypothetical protein